VRDLVSSLGLTLVIEPGRSMVANSSVFVNTVTGAVGCRVSFSKPLLCPNRGAAATLLGAAQIASRCFLTFAGLAPSCWAAACHVINGLYPHHTRSHRLQA
jgi:hypothetical protein